MLSNEYLKKRRAHNNQLCEILEGLDTMDLKAAYPIGVMGNDGKMKVQVTSSHQDKKLPLAGGVGNTLFLLKCRLPYSTVEDNEKLQQLIGGRHRYLADYVKLHMYFLVEDSKVEDFLLRASLNLSSSVPYFSNFGNYGHFILARPRGGTYDDVFDEARDLKEVAGLDADFMTELEFQNYMHMQSSSSAVGGGSVGSADELALQVMTELMGISITGIESVFPDIS
ncbi:Uncharacterized protein ehr_00821 [Ehrlichia minasensis]|nr:Uncharacterized protein ehr_00821 [Ehrlichia minasensis]